MPARPLRPSQAEASRKAGTPASDGSAQCRWRRAGVNAGPAPTAGVSGSLGPPADTQDAQVAARCSVAHLRADPLGDRVEQGITDVTVKPAVQRRRATGRPGTTERSSGRTGGRDL